MSRTKESIQNALLFFTDAIAIIAAYYISGIMWRGIYRHNGIENAIIELSLNIFTIIAAILITSVLYTEKPDFISRGKFEELRSIIAKSGIYSIIVAIYEMLRKDGYSVPRSVYVITFFVAIVLMFITRLIVKAYLRTRSENKKAQRVIIVTLAERAESTLQRAHEKDNWMRRLEGIVVLDKDMTGQEIAGVPIVANMHTMLTYIKNEIVDEVYIDVNYQIREQIKQMVLDMEDMGVTVHLKIEMLDSYKDFDTSLEYLGNIPVVTFSNRTYDWRMLLIKRCMDICGALVGLLIMGIAMIFVAPAIKLESRGPLFFKQKRVGKNGRYFEIYKFRSMYIDAEERKKELMSQNEMSGLMFKMKNDPRITKVGKFIRKTSIDELPQFINVLMGDMSLVGTRPPTVNEFKQYKGHHKRRLSMKPGITGMWQAYGRNTVDDFEEVVKMDLDYIDHWNLMLDIKILCKTAVTVFTNGGK